MGTVHRKDILKNEVICFYQGSGFYCIKKYVIGIFILLLQMFGTSSVLFNQILYGD